jgi:hypothetical protein
VTRLTGFALSCNSAEAEIFRAGGHASSGPTIRSTGCQYKSAASAKVNRAPDGRTIRSTKATLIDILNRMKADPLDQWGLSGDLLKDTRDHQSCATGFSSLLVFIMSTEECVCVSVCVCGCDCSRGSRSGCWVPSSSASSTSLCRLC